LAPYLVRNVLEALRHVNETLSICTVIVEQNVQAVLEIVNRVIVLKLGEVAFDGSTQEVHAMEDLWALF
jgi:branched-chain amino acid transport system ATP-binding protein